jgi:hypothetical protein
LALLGLTGSFEMSVFQMLFAGKMSHEVPGTGAAPDALGTPSSTRASARTGSKKRGFTVSVSAARYPREQAP